MIIKERKVPRILLKLEALERRLPASHYQRPIIESDIGKRQAGYRGETSIDYHLRFLPKKQFQILHDLRLQNQNGDYFQIDSLILSPYFIALIDVKNYRGTIQFDSQFHQLIQTFQETKKGLPDPITQINRQQIQLKEWLQIHRFSDIPIIPLIVISNPATIIEATNHSSYFSRIIHSVNLPIKIAGYKKLYPHELISKKELNKLARLLVKKDTILDYDVLDQYKIRHNEILKGVHCPNCSHLPMTRIHGSWSCRQCTYKCKYAHLAAVQDYNLLIHSTITNKQFCQFLLLPSSDVATTLLRSMKIQHVGDTKGRMYDLTTL